jgi:hypothetical protein
MSKKLTTEQDLTIFNALKIRRTFDKTQQKWFFSVIDIVAVLTNQHDYKKEKSYWTTLKSRLKKEQSQVVINCDCLKMLAKNARVELESETNKKIVDSSNFLNLNNLGRK